jgi:hypothetical protein
VFQKPAIVNDAAESSKKCFHCGLRNYTHQARCTRCRYDVWVPLSEPKNDGHVSENPRKFGRLKVGVLIATVVLSGLVLLYIREDPKGTPVAIRQTVVRPQATQEEEQPSLVPAPEHPQSELAAKQVLAGLKQFQSATENVMSYDEYDETLTRLKANLNKTLPSFIDHKPGDEFFRREVTAAVRDYTAAGSWWKTVDRNGAVLTDADRMERLIVNWTSAKMHIDNAEQMLGR